MDVRNFFYAAAGVAFILLSIFLITVSVIVLRFAKMLRSGGRRVAFIAEDFNANVSSLARTWGKLTLTGILIKILRNFFSSKSK
ncbi:MAG TPA: hypothetical protein VGQ87_03130 [Patescibacteria group bacterium]|nr:hypothetical protein [Patescibacteria group bacterium]